MKILEAQSAQLTNFEVYEHLKDLKETHAKIPKGNGRRPGNLETIIKEVQPPFAFILGYFTDTAKLIDYFEEAPSPLGSKPYAYNQRTIRTLLTKLRKFDLTKAEVIMIMNLRPTKPENLNTMIEDMEERFPKEEQQNEIVEVIAEVLGRPDGAAERQAMADNAKEARKEQLGQEAGEIQESMEVDG